MRPHCVAEPGVKVVPAGIVLRDLIDDYCGGMQDGHLFRAALVREQSGTVVVLGARDAECSIEGADTLRDVSHALK